MEHVTEFTLKFSKLTNKYKFPQKLTKRITEKLYFVDKIQIAKLSTYMFSIVHTKMINMSCNTKG
jgi:hypothetical protein